MSRMFCPFSYRNFFNFFTILGPNDAAHSASPEKSYRSLDCNIHGAQTTGSRPAAVLFTAPRLAASSGRSDDRGKTERSPSRILRSASCCNSSGPVGNLVCTRKRTAKDRCREPRCSLKQSSSLQSEAVQQPPEARGLTILTL